MIKTMLVGIAIAGAFLIGVVSANPMVEAVGGWKAAVADLQEQIDNTSGQVYEVSAVSVVPVENPGGGNHKGNDVQLRCLEGDTFLINIDTTQKAVTLSFDAPIAVLDNELVIARGSIVEEFPFDTGNIARDFSKPIGWDGRAEQIRGFQAVDIPVTITGLCVSPSP